MADIFDVARIIIGGFGTAGMPNQLIDAFIAQSAGDLSIVNNSAGIVTSLGTLRSLCGMPDPRNAGD